MIFVGALAYLAEDSLFAATLGNWDRDLLSVASVYGQSASYCWLMVVFLGVAVVVVSVVRNCLASQSTKSSAVEGRAGETSGETSQG